MHSRIGFDDSWWDIVVGMAIGFLHYQIDQFLVNEDRGSSMLPISTFMPGLPPNANADALVICLDRANGEIFPAPTLPPTTSSQVHLHRQHHQSSYQNQLLP